MSNKLTEKPESSTLPSHLIGVVDGALKRLPAADGYLPKTGGTIDIDSHIIFSTGAKLDDHNGDASIEPDDRTLKSGGNKVADWSGDNLELTRGATLPDGKAINLDNGSLMRKGTTDAGLGGGGGIALVCALSYEYKWDAGRLYVLDQNGFTIREVRNTFDVTPIATDDSTKGFIVNSRWVLDSGIVYICADNTEGAAVWHREIPGTVTFRDETIESAVLEGDELNRMLTITHGGATPINVWILLQSEEVIPSGVPVIIRQGGTGPVRIIPDDGVTILSSSSIRVLSKQYSTCVVMRLAEDTWHLSEMPAGRYQLGNIGEGVTLDPTYGSVQLCYPLNTDTTFSILNTPVEANEGDTLTLVVGWTNEALDLDFDASIKRSAAINALLPMTLEIYKSYSLHFIYRGGYWVIQAIDGPTDERID